MLRSRMKWFLALGTLVAASACGDTPTDDGTGLELRLYSAVREGANFVPVLDDTNLGVGVLEVVSIQRADPLATTRTRTFDLASGSGSLNNLPIGEGYQIFVRGFPPAGGDDVVRLYGASPFFDVVEGQTTRIGVQIGQANCVMLNHSAEELSRDGGLEDMIVKRVGFSATPLADGRVLIVGGAGVDANGQANKLHDSVEIYDPRVGQFFPANENLHLSAVRAWHTATPLDDGRIVIFGGLSVVGGAPAPTGTIEIIDPNDPVEPVKVLAVTTPPGLERWGHQATYLPFDGSVVFTGGLDPAGNVLASVLRLVPGADQDVVSGTLVAQGDMRAARAWHTSSRLHPRQDAPIIVAGGIGADGEALDVMEALTVNPGQSGCPTGQSPTTQVGCWVQPQGVVLTQARFGHRAVPLAGGRQILFVGGFTSADRSQTATLLEMVDVDFKMSGGPGQTNVGQIETGRGDLGAVVLGDGSVLLSGGAQGKRPLRSTTRLVPCPPEQACMQLFTERRLPDGCGMSQERYGHETVQLQNGTVMLLGGVGLAGQESLTTMGRAEIYFPAPAFLNEVYP